MSNPIDPILDTGTTNVMGTADIDALLGTDDFAKEPIATQQQGQGGFKPKGVAAQRAQQIKEAASVPDSDQEVTVQRITALEQELKRLISGRDGVTVKAAPAKPVDFEKLSEKDVFDLSIPIDVITHDLPDYVEVHLKDQNYVPRWVFKHSRRLGPMIAIGWTYVTEEDLAEKLKLEQPLDENGHFTLDDVVLMKCQKAKYFGQLRRNYLRTRAMVNPKEAHQIAAARVVADLKSAGTNDYNKYASEGKLSVYAPGFDI
jgi:hypothetical protein